MGHVETVIIVGAFRESVELCEDANLAIAGIFDNAKKGIFAGYPILGSDETAGIEADRWSAMPVIITPDLPRIRQRLVTLYESRGYQIHSVLSPRATLSRSARIGSGTMVLSGVNVAADVEIGQHVRLNSHCNIMHDCVIEAFVTVAPAAVLLGRVQIGEGAYVGANATVLPGMRIGREATVGAGAVVTHDVPAGSTVAGCPARVLRTQSVKEAWA